MKKILSLTLLIAALNFTAYAQNTEMSAIASGECGDNLVWELTTDGKLTISGSGEMTEWGFFDPIPWKEYSDNILEVVINEGVTSVSSNAFSYCANITEAVLPESLEYIGDWVFENCTALESIDIPDSVTEMGEGVFDDCSSLETVELSENVTFIGDFTFSGCSSLEDIAVSGKITGIGKYAFSECEKLEKINIPDGVETIGESAFSMCYKLESISIPDSVVSIGNGAFSFCKSLTNVEVHSSIAEFGDGIFDNCSGKLLIRGESGSTIESYANENNYSFKPFPVNVDFGFCGEEMMWFIDSDGVLEIDGDGAMWNFASPEEAPWHSYAGTVTKVEIDSGVTAIGNYAFYGCDELESVEIQENVTRIGDSAFASSALLSEVTILNSTASIGKNVFADCSSRLVIKGYGDSTAEEYADENGYNFEELPIASGEFNGIIWEIKDKTLTISGSGAMPVWSWSFEVPWLRYREHIEKVIIEDGITSIGDWAFYACEGFTEINIPESVTSIGIAAFGACENLTSVEISAEISEIGRIAFGACNSLESINVSENNPYYSSSGGVLFNKAGTELLQYPSGKADTQYTIPAGVNSIAGSAFTLCKDLKNVSIPENVENIGEYAFDSCTNLAEVTVLSKDAVIEKDSFSGCATGFVLQGYLDSTVQVYAADNSISFIILDKVTLDCEKSAEKLTVTLSEPRKGVLIVASYDDNGRLKEVMTTPVDTDKNEYELNVGSDNIKVMMWNRTEGLRPIGDVLQ